MPLYAIDPIRDERWADFLQKHPAASVFHTPEWLKALQRTYGYEPVAFSTSPPGHSLFDGIPFCRISSWPRGERLVSLPFSDHCAPLTEGSKAASSLLVPLRERCEQEKWKSLEIRATDEDPHGWDGFEKSKRFFLHSLDLRPSLEEIFRNLHKDCVQRKIQRAEREHLTHEEGTSEDLLARFYHLLLMTRRRHGLPPQPLAWFQNLIACLGSKVRIRIASKAGRTVAAILTLQHKNVLVYKYGCSDEKFNSLGGMQMLLWKAIQVAKEGQLTELDMGRTEPANVGLVAFKDRWGATSKTLTYLQYPQPCFHSLRDTTQGRVSRLIFACLPNGLLSATGRLLYRYMG